MTARLLACLLMAAPFLGACVSDRTLFQSLDDTSAATEVKTRLLGAGMDGRFMEVDVAVVDRFVLLSGRVATQEHRRQAERIAWDVPSVDEVANEIVIDYLDLGRDLNDAWITEQIRLRLIGDDDIRGTNYNIQVYSGRVFLLGVARSEDELRRAAEHASLVGGVQKVISYVRVRTRGAPPDISLAASPQDQDIAGAPIRLAPPPAVPAPIVAPDSPPMSRQTYSDPYAAGAAAPPGSVASPGAGGAGLESRPLPPLRANR